MEKLSLVPIGKSGQPIDPCPTLPRVAQDVCAATAKMYECSGYHPPWIGYLARRGEQYVGTCAFKSAPKNGAVELAYMTFPPFQGQGVATQMAHGLLDIARSADPFLVLMAYTRPERNASTTILRKLGFRLVGTVEHPDDGTVWEWRK